MKHGESVDVLGLELKLLSSASGSQMQDGSDVLIGLNLSCRDNLNVGEANIQLNVGLSNGLNVGLSNDPILDRWREDDIFFNFLFLYIICKL